MGACKTAADKQDVSGKNASGYQQYILGVTPRSTLKSRSTLPDLLDKDAALCRTSLYLHQDQQNQSAEYFLCELNFSLFSPKTEYLTITRTWKWK